MKDPALLLQSRMDTNNQGIKDAIEGGHKQRIMSSIKEIETEMHISLLFLKFRPRQILNQSAH